MLLGAFVCAKNIKEGVTLIMSTTNQELNTMRLTKLEHKCRKLQCSRILNFVLLSTLIGLYVLQYLGMDITTGKTVSAGKFVLKDDRGHIRAELSSQQNTTNFALYDVQGVHRASLALSDGDPGFHLYDESGFRRAVIGISEEGPRIVFMDPSGIRHTGLVLMDNGTLGVYQAKGKEKKPNLSLYQSVKYLNKSNDAIY